jgi:hypothetical protein
MPSTRRASSETSPVYLEARKASLPAARPANQGKRLVKEKKKDRQMMAYNPDVHRNEEHLCVGREERHSLPRTLLLLILGVHP